MADLHKFIRQQFFDNNWAKECDVSNIPVEKLKEISDLFCQLSIKSKLNIILTYSNSPIPSDRAVANYVESVELQALDEEDNFVRAVATILHSRKTFGHLTFDISETNETFSKTLEALSSVQLPDAPTSKVPLLAAVIDARITNSALAKGAVVDRNEEMNATCLNTFCGFRLRDKSPALRMKEAYLDRLQEECERRRKHVPIPGRSFSKHDSGEDSPFDAHHQFNDHNHRPPILGSRRAPSFPRKTPVLKTPDFSGNCSEALSSMGSSLGLNARAKLLAMHNRSVSNGNDVRRSSVGLGCDRNSFNVTSTTNKRRPIGIKMLDFEELPATGLQAKKLRKEQQERDREAKRRDREEKAQERRDAREAARQAQLHDAATAGAARSPTATTTLTSTTSAGGLVPIPPETTSVQTSGEHNLMQNLTWQPWTQFGVVVPHTQPPSARLSQRPGDNNNVDEDDDDDLEDDDDEDLTADGAFHLTAPPGFRGFTQQQQPVSTTPGTTTTFVIQQPSGFSLLPQQQTFLAPHAGTPSIPPPPVFSAQPRIRFIRPLVSAQPPLSVGGTGTSVVTTSSATTTTTTPARVVQLPDGSFALIAAASRPTLPPTQLSSTLLIAGPPVTGQFHLPTATSAGFATTTTDHHSLQCLPNAAAPLSFSSPVNQLSQAPTLTQPTQMLLRVPHPPDTSQSAMIAAKTMPPPRQTYAPSHQLSFLRPQPPRLIQIRPRILSPSLRQAQTVPLPPRLLPASQRLPDFTFTPTSNATTAASTQPSFLKISPQATSVVAMTKTEQQQHPEPPRVVAAAAPAATEQLHLTPAQYQSIQNLFTGANRLTRPDKALILSFVTGHGVNPHPEAGNALRIHLSEYREHVKDSVTGNIMEVAADTHIHLDYATGKFEHVKSYRTLLPDQLPANTASSL